MGVYLAASHAFDVHRMKQLWLLRRYLRQRFVSKNLATRIQKFIEYQNESQGRLVQKSQLKIIDGLSNSLQNELTYEMLGSYGPENLGVVKSGDVSTGPPPLPCSLDSGFSERKAELCLGCRVVCASSYELCDSCESQQTS